MNDKIHPTADFSKESPTELAKRLKDERSDKKLKQVHNSSLECYFRCGYQYYLKYIRGLKTPNGCAIVCGIAVDDSVTKNMQNKMDFLDLLPLEEVETIARDSVKKAFEVEVALKRGKEQEAGRSAMRDLTIDKAVRMAKKHYEYFAPKINPIKVQWQWVLKWEGYPYRIVGAVDILERIEEIETNIIIDTKTTGNTPGKTVADKSTQLSTYAMAEERRDGKVPLVRLDYLIDLKLGVKAVPFWSRRDKGDFQIIMNRFRVFADSMKAGNFPPVDSAHPWACSPDYCGFWENDCIYAWREKPEVESGIFV